MIKKFMIFAVILTTVFLTACNNTGEDPNEEIEEENGAGEELEEEETPDEEETAKEDDAEKGNGDDEAESEDEAPEDEDAEGSDEEEGAVSQGILKNLYGLWRMESEEENGADDLLMEIDMAEAKNIENKNTDFEYIRFGYESSEFFSMEEVIEIEAFGEGEGYFLTLSPIDREDNTSRYTIELVDDTTLILVYLDAEDQEEMVFTKK